MPDFETRVLDALDQILTRLRAVESEQGRLADALLRRELDRACEQRRARQSQVPTGGCV